MKKFKSLLTPNENVRLNYKVLNEIGFSTNISSNLILSYGIIQLNHTNNVKVEFTKGPLFQARPAQIEASKLISSKNDKNII